MNSRSKAGFTLVELLIVIAILAILSVAAILVINPAQLLKQGRDATRLSDMAALNSALALYNTDAANGFMGTSTYIYVSIPDSSPTCANLGLPTLPSGQYSCVASSTLRKTDGTGWVPVNFSSLTFGNPLPNLPIDPINATSTGTYYTYAGGSWALSAVMESTKQAVVMASDGGRSAYAYEVGSNLTLTPTSTLRRAMPVVALTINAPALTTSKVYDGNTSAVVAAGTLSGVASGDVVTVSATATYNSATIETGKTITVVYTLGGADAAQYSAPTNYVVNTGAITTVQLSIGNPTITTSKTYDRTTSAGVTASTLSGVANGNTVTVSATATYDSASVGTGKTITVVYTLGGANASNYTAPTNYVVNTGVVSAIELQIGSPTVTTSKTYDGTKSAAVTAGSLTGVISGDTVTVSATATYDSASVGTGKTITVEYTLSGASSGNYSAPGNYILNTGIIVSNIANTTCKAILDAGSSTGSGVYTIDPNGGSNADAFQAYCDMTTDGGGWALVALPTDSYSIFSEPTGLLDPTASLGARNSNYWSSGSTNTFTQIRFTDSWPSRSYYDIATFGSAVSMSSLMTSYPTYSQYPVATTNISSSIGSTCFIVRGKSSADMQWSDGADWLFMGFHSLCSVPISNTDAWDVYSYSNQWVVGARDNSGDPQSNPTAVGRMTGGCHWNANSCPATNRTIIWVR